MSKKNIYLWSDSIVSGKLIPILWFSSKSYYEEHGSKVSEWQWHDPFIHERSEDEILAMCKENPPDFFGFSVYIWSHLKADSIAQKIKQQHPKCLIVYGGPQIDIKYSNDFFQKKPWVDLVVPSDVYGEVIITNILDNFDTLNYADIPEVYYSRGGMKFKSKHDFVKRQFQWPSNAFAAQKDYFNFDTTNSMIVYESSRGCPYGCTYCDWGGGTYTKVVKKPMETIFAELEFLCANKIESFYFADANFGIFKDDIKIIEHVAELKKKYGYPLAMSVENAKNNLDRVVEIQKLLIKNQLSWYYKISIQNPHDDIKKNIERVDIPFTDQLEAIRKIKAEYDAPILIETILGLPGDSYQRTLEAIDIFHASDVESHRPAIWNLLPEAPAYAPKERAKFKIETKWFEIFTWPFRYKKSASIEEGVRTISTADALLFENVISTYSYSKFEWCDMLALTMLSGVANLTGFSFFTEYIQTTHNVNPSVVYDKLYKDIIKNKKFTSEFLNEKIGFIPDHLYDLVENSEITQLGFDIGEDFPLLLSPHTYLTFVIMLDPQGFFNTVSDYFAKEFSDPAISDLGRYLGQSIIDINYDPDEKREFTSNHNWYSHFTNKQPLTAGQYQYNILDDQLKLVRTRDFEYSNYPTESDYNEKVKLFFYHRGSNGARKKYAQQMVETKLG